MSADFRHTRGLIDRLVTDAVRPDDRAHTASCPACGPILMRAAAFDDELRRSARALVVGEMPRGILDPGLGRPAGPTVGSRRAAPGLAVTFAAIAILLAATAIALAPGTSPPPSPTPTASPSVTKAPFPQRFRTTDVIRGRLAKLYYTCNDGASLSSVGPEPDAVAEESTVCVAPASIGPFMAAVIVGESASGEVVELVIKADIVGDDTADSRTAVAMAVATVFSMALTDEGAGQDGSLWVKAHLPELERSGDADVVLRNIAFHAELGVNGYLVTVRGVRAS